MCKRQYSKSLPKDCLQTIKITSCTWDVAEPCHQCLVDYIRDKKLAPLLLGENKAIKELVEISLKG
jgi:uncharacterized protein YcbX